MQDTMQRSIRLNSSMFSEYLRFIANRRCIIGLDQIYDNSKKSISWMSNDDLKKEKLFETRVIEYQTGGALN